MDKFQRDQLMICFLVKLGPPCGLSEVKSYNYYLYQKKKILELSLYIKT